MKKDEAIRFNRPDEGVDVERAALLEQALRGQGMLLAEAQQARALLQSTFDALGDAIIVTDPAGRITQANGAVADLFGLAPEAVIGEDCHMLLAEGQVCPHTSGAGQESVTGGSARSSAIWFRPSGWRSPARWSLPSPTKSPRRSAWWPTSPRCCCSTSSRDRERRWN